MGLLDCASANSIWRGYDYYKENKVSDIKNIADGVFEGTVRGSGTKAYSSILDAFHPRKSKCNCPHADGKRIVCKHIVALYFTAYHEEFTEKALNMRKSKKSFKRSSTAS